MPDLTLEYYHSCDTNLFWETIETGSTGTKYTVRYGSTPLGPYQYDYSCTCVGNAKFRKECRHIKAVKASKARCGWHQFHDPLEPTKDPTTGEHRCPKCTGAVSVEAWGV